MNKPRRWVSIIVGLVSIGTLVLSSCSSSTADDAPSPSVEESDSPESSPSEGDGDAAEDQSDTDDQGDEVSGERISIRLAHTASAAHLPVAVARDQGLFEKAGLDVTYETLTTVALAQSPNLVGRQFDIAFGTEPEFLNAARSGIPVTIVGGAFLEDPKVQDTLLVVPEDSPIQKVGDLKGATIAAPSLGGNLNLSTQVLILNEGLSLSDVKFVQMETGNMPDALAAGRVDAAEVTSPVARMLTSNGYRSIAFTPAAIGEPIHQALWLADSTWASENSNAVEAFVAAMDEAVAWIRGNPDEAREFLVKTTNVPEEFQPYVLLMDFDAHYPPEDLRAWADALTMVTGTSYDELDFDSLIAPVAK